MRNFWDYRRQVSKQAVLWYDGHETVCFYLTENYNTAGGAFAALFGCTTQHRREKVLWRDRESTKL